MKRFKKKFANEYLQYTIAIMNLFFILLYCIENVYIKSKYKLNLDNYLNKHIFIYALALLTFIALISFVLAEHSKVELNGYKKDYTKLLNEKIWVSTILTVILVVFIVVYDYFFEKIIYKSRFLTMYLSIVFVFLMLREVFAFLGFKKLIFRLQQKMRYTDMLLEYNVNLSKDLKKNMDIKKQEIELARKIQLALIPEKAQIIGDTFSIKSKLISATDMSGDYYDYFYNSKIVVWIVADVMGKGICFVSVFFFIFFGMKADMLASNLRTCIKMMLGDMQFKESVNPGELLEQINISMYNDLDKIGAYITMAIGVFNIETNVLEVASAGHVPPILVSSDFIEKLDIKSTAIGLKKITAYQTKKIILKKGDSVVFYTDGAWDVRDNEKVRLGSRGFVEYLKTNKPKEIELIDSIENSLNSYRGKNEFYDDVTISVLDMV